MGQEIQDQNGNYPAYVNIAQSVTYVPNGPTRRIDYADGTQQYDYLYDQSYRLIRALDRKDGTRIYDKRYSYDTRDDLTEIRDALDASQTETFTHTPRQFIATADGPYGAQTYTYDAVGNRSSFEVVENALAELDTYTYPTGSNKLSDVILASGHTRSMSYDAAGNMTYDLREDGGWSYTYNNANRMSSMAKDGVVQAEYKYNAQGQQVIRQLNGQGVTIHAVFDLDGNRIAEYNAETDELLAEYVWLNGQPLAVISGGQTYYVRPDHIGRPAFATDDTGAVVWEASYKPFGEVQASTGTPINLRFPGQWFSSESELYQNWMRDYDPTTGRYIQGDPLGLIDGASLYGYALQSPNRFVDPRGEQAAETIAGGTAGVGAALLCAGPQAAGCAIVLACAGAAAAIIYLATEMTPDECKACAAVEPANDDFPPPPPPADGNCAAEYNRLALLHSVLLGAIAEGLADSRALRSYVSQARQYNARCTPKGFPRLPVNFIK